MVSPSATSPALSTAEDDGLFFRTAPSDARQGVVMTQNCFNHWSRWIYRITFVRLFPVKKLQGNRDRQSNNG